MLKITKIPVGSILIVAIFSVVIASPLNELKGPAFSNPKEIMPPKNDSWLSKKINYPPKYRDADLFLTLDQQLYPALLPLINQFGSQNDLNIKVHEGTCGISSGMLSRKEADIGGYCCPPARTDRINGLEFHTLGISSMVIFVNPANKQLNNLTFSQLQQVFNGEIQRWSDINPSNSNQLINPIARLHCKLRPGHWRLILDNEELFSTQLNEVSQLNYSRGKFLSTRP